MTDQAKTDKGFEALERCIECCDGTLTAGYARVELTHARQMRELLEKVAWERHYEQNGAPSHRLNEYMLHKFDTCPDELCAKVREVLK